MSKVARGLGNFFILIGVWVTISPESLFSVVNLESRGGLYAAAAFRLFFGLVLVLAARTSRAPTAFRILGGLTILVGLVLPFIPIDSWVKLIRSATGENLAVYRFAGGGMGILLGSFITYAALPQRSDA